MCSESDTNIATKRKSHPDRATSKWSLLRWLAENEGCNSADAERYLLQVFVYGPAQARRIVNDLDPKYLCRERVGNRKLCYLTELGKAKAAAKNLPLDLIVSQANRSQSTVTTGPLDKPVEDVAATRSRAKEINPATILRRTQIDEWPRLSFAGRTRNFAFALVSDLDEIVTATLYEQVHVGTADGLPVFKTFIQPERGDPIQGRRWGNDLGHLVPAPRPEKMTLGVGVLLEDNGQEYALVRDADEDGYTQPRIGIIMESAARFWVPLLRRQPEPGDVIHVTRTGAQPRVKFQFSRSAEGARIDLTRLPDIDLDRVIARLADPARLHEHIDPLGRSHNLRPR